MSYPSVCITVVVFCDKDLFVGMGIAQCDHKVDNTVDTPPIDPLNIAPHIDSGVYSETFSR